MLGGCDVNCLVCRAQFGICIKIFSVSTGKIGDFLGEARENCLKTNSLLPRRPGATVTPSDKQARFDSWVENIKILAKKCSISIEYENYS